MSEKSILDTLNVPLLEEFLSHAGWAEFEKILDKEILELHTEACLPMKSEAEAMSRNVVIGRIDALKRVKRLGRLYISMATTAAEMSRQDAERKELRETRAKAHDEAISQP